jgi:RND family efflux transporter MFP subunit
MSISAKFIPVEPIPAEENGGSAAGEAQSAAPMRTETRRSWMGIAQIVGVIAVVSVAIVYSQEQAPEVAPSAGLSGQANPTGPTGQSAVADALGAPPVRVVVPERTSSLLTLTTNGSVQVRNYVALTPQVAGAVVAVAESMRAGGEFQAGDVLFKIDPRDYQLALDQANAEVAAAETRLMLREAEGDAARGNYALLHGDKPVPMLVAKIPQIELNKAELDGAKARAARAQLDLSRTQFSLPFAGRVTESTVGLGQMLSKGQTVGQVFALEALEVVVPVSQEELVRLNPVTDMTALVKVGGQEIPAIVDRASAELDERTRFARLYLSLADDVVIPPGTFVEVTLSGAEVADTFVLPESVEQAGSMVWRIAEGTLQPLTPTLLARTEAGLIVEAFDAGEGIVVGSVPGARPGMAVTPVLPEAADMQANSVVGVGE